MKITFITSGAAELAHSFINTHLIEQELLDAGQKSAVVLHNRLSTYPPQRPSANYRRTRNLGNRWEMKVESFGGGVEFLVTNPVEYEPYVMAPLDEEPHQAEIHQGVWATTEQILREKQQQIVGFFTVARDRIVEKLKG